MMNGKIAMKEWLAAIISAVMVLSGCGTDMDVTEPTEIIEDTRARDMVATMTLDEKICQLMFVTPESITNTGAVTVAGEVTRLALEKYPVGGIVYFAQNLKSREQITSMIENTQSYSKVPLFIGVDEEGGRVARIGSKPQLGTTKIKAMKNVQSMEEAYIIGETLGKDLKGLLFNVDFAPVADVIVDVKNSEIGDRSFGEDPYWVGKMTESVVKGMEKEGVSSVLKHFPGHGSTVANSHTGYSESTRTVDQLRECELIPFKMGIEAGSDFVMVSHMTLVNIEPEKLPSSLSRTVITDLLKNELGFDGIVITDALNMGAVTKEYGISQAAVYAICAGADMLLMPQNVEEAKNALLNAVKTGEITEERINESVEKILRIKIEKGMI